ncbi:hypothetical protein [Neptunomonas japonica]|uniref:Uncharacterized protein n=1 Tax=Neptunomonas japonica JAMM 1380 TaxID=1441457 RepID=A0A7R6PIN5_9GAMM|nr:hypothetical protein [Neptunomonas japonica]BBB30323.1 conserved hypothetical protein [Neptunomonas japonica JAMM 1380]
MDFGLACEGITDHVVIENILCGFFEEDITDNIAYLQPPLDETDSKQLDFGGWNQLISYLSGQTFREDVLNQKYIIIQIDTDISQEKGFDVPFYDEDNKELAVDELINRVIIRLEQAIDFGEARFSDLHRDKIIYCICVHSLECWILAHYLKARPSSTKTKGCFNKLKRELAKSKRNPVLTKDKDTYDHISMPFYNSKKAIESAASNDISMDIFIRKLEAITYP